MREKKRFVFASNRFSPFQRKYLLNQTDGKHKSVWQCRWMNKGLLQTSFYFCVQKNEMNLIA